MARILTPTASRERHRERSAGLGPCCAAFLVSVVCLLCGCTATDADVPSPLVTSSPAQGPVSPAVEPTRDKLVEWYQDVVRCLRDRGWRARYDPNIAGLSIDQVPPSQRGAVNSAVEDCEKLAGKAPNDVPLSPELAKAEYDYAVAMKKCLV